MNAPFFRSQDKSLIGAEIVAAAWRGACLELYSRGEAAIDCCLAKLTKAGWKLDKASKHPGAKSRLVALQEFVRTNGLGTHAKAAAEALDRWADLNNDRLLLAHGLMTVHKDGSVRLQLSAHTPNSSERLNDKTLSQLDCAGSLRRLEDALHAVKCQLGTVGAYSPPTNPS
jgi:hypothetical protein